MKNRDLKCVTYINIPSKSKTVDMVECNRYARHATILYVPCPPAAWLVPSGRIAHSALALQLLPACL